MQSVAPTPDPPEFPQIVNAKYGEKIHRFSGFKGESEVWGLCGISFPTRHADPYDELLHAEAVPCPTCEERLVEKAPPAVAS